MRGVGMGLEASEHACPDEDSLCRFCEGGVFGRSPSSCLGWWGGLFVVEEAGGVVGAEELLLLGLEAAAARCMNYSEAVKWGHEGNVRIGGSK